MSRPFTLRDGRWRALVTSAFALVWPAHVAAAEDGAATPPSEVYAAQPATNGGNTEPPNASAREEAAQRFEAARLLYAQGNYELAAVELERAHALVPDPRVLHKLGKLWLHLQRHAQARRTFERYLAESGPELSPESRRDVEADLERLREKTAELQVSVNVSGCEIVVDDIAFGRSPLSAPLVLEAGERRVMLRKDGYVTHHATLTLSGNEARRLDVALEPEISRAPPPRLEPVERPRPAPRPHALTSPPPTTPTTLTWVAWSVTGVLAAGAAGAGVLGLIAANDLDALKDDPDASRDALERQASRAELRLLTADILAAATLLAAGAALYVTLSGPQDSPRRSSQAVSVRVSTAGVTFTTPF